MNVDALLNLIRELEKMDAEIGTIHSELTHHHRDLVGRFDEQLMREIPYIDAEIRKHHKRLAELWTQRQDLYDRIHLMIRDEQTRKSLQQLGQRGVL